MINEKNEQKINWREKLVLVLIIFTIKMIHPWEYDHQFKQFWEEIKDIIK